MNVKKMYDIKFLKVTKLVIFQNVSQGFQLKIVALCDVTVGTTTFFRLMFTAYKCFNPLPNM